MARKRRQAALIGAFGPPVTPACFNSNDVNPVIYSQCVLGAVRVQTGGRDGRPNCANQSCQVTTPLSSR
ncbi:hypothetical protein Y032_0019g3859 [Ancylostoma ceylanicum]|nr:hypothetical protein Y032_0019g3859 [Ancylostoma ceylanicum]